MPSTTPPLPPPCHRTNGRSRPRGSLPADGSALFLGWEKPDERGGFGFAPRAAETPSERPLLYAGDGHLLCVAPTGAGKGTGLIVPTLLTYPGSLIVTDVKGENFQVTARYRRQLGQQVVVLDPFGVVTEKTDGLNPFDLFGLAGADVESDAEMLAAQLAVGHEFGSDRYWEDTGRGLLSGLIAHLASAGKPEERTPTALRGLLYHDDLDYHLAVVLDAKGAGCPLARDEFVSYLATPSDKTRPCIRSTATTFVKCLGSAAVARALERSSFELRDLLEGRPVTVYLVVPPEKLASHQGVLRLWVATLLGAVLRRKRLPRRRTLFLIDEAAQLGPMDLLRQAVTLLRGYGMQVWTFWQDLSQLRQLYKRDWETLVANAAVLQAFGLPGHGAWRGWRTVLGRRAPLLEDLAEEEMLVSLPDRRCGVYRRANYLRDAAFAGRFAPNPRFLVAPEAEPAEQGS